MSERETTPKRPSVPLSAEAQAARTPPAYHLIGADQTTGRSEAPWTDEQVAALNDWQRNRRFHPFTCPGDHPECASRRELIATSDGWVCACGKYRQGWAHDVMTGGARG